MTMPAFLLRERFSRSVPLRAALLLVAAVFFAAAMFFAAPAAWTQALPTAEASPISTGFSIPSIAGSLHWAVTAAGSLDWGYYSHSGVAPGASISGDVGYLSANQRHPFSTALAAGKSWGWSGQPSYEFVSLGMSQGFNLKRWNFNFSDSLSYLPNTAIGGFSGIPGLGDLGVPPIQVGPDAGQGLLTGYSPEISNVAGGSVQRSITGKTSVNASGSYSILRFVNTPPSTRFGLQNDTVTGSGGFTHRLNGRNTFGGNFAYSSYIFLNNLSYGVPEGNFVSETASGTYTRQISRRMAITLAAGPEFTQINVTGGTSTLSAYVDATMAYTSETGSLQGAYVRSTNSGYGVIGGGLSDSVSFTATRIYNRVWDAAATVAWSRTSSLPFPNVPQNSYDTVVAGVQVSRALARSLSAFGSYTIEKQTNNSTFGAINLFTGSNNIVGFGITYSPLSRRFGRH